MLNNERLAERLRMERARKKVTQADVAEATGTTAVAICQYETAQRTPSLQKLAALADYYGVSLDYLVGE